MSDIIVDGPEYREDVKYVIDGSGVLCRVERDLAEFMTFEPMECIHRIARLEKLPRDEDYFPLYRKCSLKCLFFSDPVECLGERGKKMVRLKLCSGELLLPRGGIADLRHLAYVVENHFGSFWLNEGDTFQKCNVYINGTVATYGKIYEYDAARYHSYGGPEEFWKEVERQEFPETHREGEDD